MNQVIPDYYKADTFMEDENTGVHRGQVRFAYKLAETHADQLMFVHGIGWHRWDGARWIEDKAGYAHRAVLKTLRGAHKTAFRDHELQADINKCESAAGLSGVLAIAASLEAFAFTVEQLDADPYLLNVANGTLDLRTMELRAHNPADRITKVTGAAYDPEAAGKVWEAFLASSLPNEAVRGFLQRYAGLALAGTVLEHALAILVGEGRNGKGIFYGTVGSAFGDYAITAEADLFMHRENAHPTGEMDLLGTRWVVVSESDQDRKLAQATVKRLTGGDKIKARRMRQDFVQFDPSHTPLLVTNFLPKIKGNDPALWARIRVVPFAVVIPEAEQDVNLKDKLKLELDAVLTWAIRGWVEYQRAGLQAPPEVVAATKDYQTSTDDVGQFIEDTCFADPGAWVKSADLYAAWEQWARQHSETHLSQRAFGEDINKRGFELKRTGSRGHHRVGIGLAPGANPQQVT